MPASKRRARPLASSTQIAPRVASSPQLPKTVALQWKLPARLRKPIREQLQKERHLKKQRQAMVHFSRRPLVTQPPAGLVSRGPRNQGAEHHTGDVYKNSRPAMRVTLPPYAGRVARRMASSKPVRPMTAFKKPASAPKRVTRLPATVLRNRKVSQPKAFFSYDRDAPFTSVRASVPVAYQPHIQTEPEAVYQTEVTDLAAAPVVEKPKRMLAMPFSFSFWPVSLFSSKKKFQFKPGEENAGRHSLNEQRRGVNIVFLLVGCLLAGGLVWNLQGVGRGLSVLSSVEGRSHLAYEKIMAAQAAFAATDFSEGETQLAGAGELLGQARSDMRQALASAQYVLKVLDVTGTVASGDELLLAGENLTTAGTHIARGAAGFFDVSFLSEEGEAVEKPQTLIDAIELAQTEFSLGLTSLEAAQKSLANVKSPLLPEDVQQQTATLLAVMPRAHDFLDSFLQQADTMLGLLGRDRQRQYLLLFANPDELRPVGGFIGTVGLVNVDRGQVENIDISSVYDGDGQLKEFIAPPDPLLPIVNRWYLRDANWFADYPTNARKVAQFFEKEGGPTVDGVMLLTPAVIERLLAITGPIEVPAYGVTLSAENFQAITQDQVTYSYDRELNKPKQFLADATPILLNRLFKEGDNHLAILQAFSQSLHEKDLLLYFKDEAAQGKLVEAGWAGALLKDAPGFLLVNNANIGGHKSDQFIEQEIDYRVEVSESGQPSAVVTIRRTHHGPEEVEEYDYPDGEDPAHKDNIVYQRVLVPKGAKLLEAKGYTDASQVPRPLLGKSEGTLTADLDVATWQASQKRDANGTAIGEESGYTFFANWIVTKPGQTTVTLYRYMLPQTVALPGTLNAADHMAVTVAKQSGAQRTMLRASLKLPETARIVHTVPQTGVTQDSNQEMVYRGPLSTDVVVGVVYTRGK